MKTMKMKMMIGGLAMGIVLSSAVPALAADAVAPLQHPRNGRDVVESLSKQVLGKEQIEDLFATGKTSRGARPVSDLQVFAQLGVTPSPSNEGLPSLAHPTDLSDVSDIIGSAYSSAELISRALEDRRSLPIGQRIRFLEEEASRIIAFSGTQPTEILLRLTLNRGVDALRHMLPIAGVNTEEVARLMANFMRENFVLAASFGNNKVGVDSRLTSELDRNVADFLRRVSIAEYGRIYASLLWRYSQDMTSDSAKAVLMMRLVGYLGWDLNMDLRRREKPIAQMIADIYMLEHSELYDRLLQALASGQEPTQEEVAQFRRKVFTILERLPGRLKDAGIR